MWEISLVALIIVYFLIFLYENFRNDRSPPGPYRYPPFGNLFQMFMVDKQSHVALHHIAKKYGDVMTVKLGLVETVVLSSYEAVKGVFTKDEVFARECSGVLWDRNLQKNVGLIFSEGPVWVETRKFCREALRTHGYGNREVVNNLLLDELSELFKFMEEGAGSNAEGRLHFDSNFFHRALMNIIVTWVMGKRFDYDDPDFKYLLQCDEDLAKNAIVGAGFMMAYPFLRHVIPETLGYNCQIKGVKGFHKTAVNYLRERKQIGEYKKNPICFTDEFVRMMDLEADNKNTMYTEDHFGVIFADIVQTGTDTTSSAVNFTLLHLVCNQQIQGKVYDEICQVIGSGRLPVAEDKILMPYTQAVLLEGLRWSRVAVFGAPRKALQPFIYRNWNFKKGAVIMFNLHAIFFDEEYWGDPHIFRPERFIDAKGSVDLKKMEKIVAFGAGKRNCFGEVLARDTSFLFITSLIQRFHLTLPPGSKPTLEAAVSLNLYPYPYDSIVTIREDFKVKSK